MLVWFGSNCYDIHERDVGHFEIELAQYVAAQHNVSVSSILLQENRF